MIWVFIEGLLLFNEDFTTVIVSFTTVFGSNPRAYSSDLRLFIEELLLFTEDFATVAVVTFSLNSINARGIDFLGRRKEDEEKRERRLKRGKRL